MQPASPRVEERMSEPLRLLDVRARAIDEGHRFARVVTSCSAPSCRSRPAFRMLVPALAEFPTRPAMTKIAILASDAPEALEAAALLRARYGDVPLDEADVIVALGGDGLMLQALHDDDEHGQSRSTA